MQLAETLFEHDLVDELRLMIDPLVWAAASAFFATTARLGRSGWSTAR
jgi:riboflavin biosynthesis pyrimidine reductase